MPRLRGGTAQRATRVRSRTSRLTEGSWSACRCESSTASMPSTTPGTTRGATRVVPDAITRTGSVSGRVDDDGNNATWSDHVTDEEYNAAAPE
jgi:hypothetical protein